MGDELPRGGRGLDWTKVSKMSEYEDQYLEYLAEHESGFLCDDPPDLIDTENALRAIIDLPFTVHRAPRRVNACRSGIVLAD